MSAYIDFLKCINVLVYSDYAWLSMWLYVIASKYGYMYLCMYDYMFMCLSMVLCMHACILVVCLCF